MEIQDSHSEDLMSEDESESTNEASSSSSSTVTSTSKTLAVSPAKDKKPTTTTTATPLDISQQCIFLLLESRMLLKEMIAARMREDRWAFGNLTIEEIQNLLRSQKEEAEDDWISQIQELKRNLVSEVRRNYALERELTGLDRKIALILKARGHIKDLVRGPEEKKRETKRKDKDSSAEAKFDVSNDPKKLILYQNLFYLLQTEPKYLANLVYLMSQDDMERFLDTVILSLFGDAFSPREEFLLLSLFKLAIQREIQAVTTISDLVKAESVVPKMIITYNKRKAGADYLRSSLGPILIGAVKKDVNLELKPNLVYQGLISEKEIRTGEKTAPEMRNLPDEKVLDMPEIQELLNLRVGALLEVTQQFLDSIVASINRIPYGIRWICKQIAEIAERKFSGTVSSRRAGPPSAARLEILKVTGYYIYYRFINLLIVTPDAFEVVKPNEVTINSRKNLVMISKVLQHLFNNTRFGASERWLMPLNDWIAKNTPIALQYLEDLLDVPDPEDHLKVDKYVELTQKTKPVIVISLLEIASTHRILSQHIEELASDNNDPMRLILKELDHWPMPQEVAREDDREIQLTLTSRLKERVEEEDPDSSLYQETKNLIINLLKVIPLASSSSSASSSSKSNASSSASLLATLEQAKANSNGNAQLEASIVKALANLKKLDAQKVVSKADDYSGFLRDVALEVANRQSVREQQQKEIKRLNTTLKNLNRHQTYLNEQIAQWNNYLVDVKSKSYAVGKKSTKRSKAEASKIGPFKYSGAKLVKKGVIADAELPLATLKKMTFQISSDMAGGFEVAATVAGVEVKSIEIQLDELLERNSNGIARLDLDQISLDVNMTLHLLNKLFMQQK